MDFAIKNDIAKAPKTGDWRQVTPMVDQEKCVGCGTCVKYCPEATILMTSEQETTNSKKAVIDYHWCKGCGVCAEVCPVKAISMKK